MDNNYDEMDELSDDDIKKLVSKIKEEFNVLDYGTTLAMFGAFVAAHSPSTYVEFLTTLFNQRGYELMAQTPVKVNCDELHEVTDYFVILRAPKDQAKN